MSNQFLKLRRSAIPGKIPETSSLDLGELAMNTHDGLLFMKKSSSFGEEIIPIGVSTTSGSFTGSFSGSFTGSLEGTASFALSASWVPKTIPGGSNYQIQFNSGSEFSGSPELIWNYNSSSLAHGDSVVASGMYSHAEGSLTVASGDYSHAEGVETIASGSYSHAEGSLTVASGDYSHAEGELSIASGNRSHAEGESTTASGINSHAEGAGTSAEGAISHAEGYSTIARGQVSHAEGSLTVASGDYSHAEGVETIASGSYSHSEGYYAQAEGYGSHAEGYDSIASGSFSHAEGYSTKAYGESSHSEGNNTEASGEISHAEGLDTIASGVASHAEGDATIALGYASHAEGCATIAAAPYQHVQGKYNVTSSIESAFIVGNGTNNDDRSNLIFAAENQVIISGSVISNYGFTGSLQGTASFAVSASWAPTAETDPVFSAWLLTSPLSGYVPTSRTLTINGVTYDLSSNRSWTVGDLLSSGSYTNPSWLVSIPWSKITSAPTTLAGYGITDAIDGSGTANQIPYFVDSNTLGSLSTSTYPSLTELSYVKGVTSAIQTQITNKEDKSSSTSGSVISFTTPQVYNSLASPSSSDITDDLTGARIGVIQKIYHNKLVAPTFPAGWVRLGSTTYNAGNNNIIYAEWVSGTRVEYWIVRL